MIQVSIITVTLNSADDLEATIKSVIGQIDINKEYIVVDGNSTDHTSTILNKYKTHIDKVVIEKDDGLYDAMNKGLNNATGKYVIFLNAGDVFYSNNSLSQLNLQEIIEPHWIAGSWLVSYNNGQFKYHSPREINSLWRGMVFSHQALLAPRKEISQYGFNLSEQTAADFGLIVRSMTQGCKFISKRSVVISKISSGGVSDRHRLSSLNSTRKICLKYRLKNPIIVDSYYFYRMVREIIAKIIKLILRYNR